ncbi:YARHG domain-containing protein [Legionella waltersii]|uniref:YARHG domain-containing protein n=1 Tax=Legionella waltersii TaxID=66969 RepID=A0A0W1AMN4_9GAMM|nr:YARHG domain-containing protein [Legionella waltersii]KTD82591.1 hypothetical protein Lwal_0520 [Legionella waltersii]SNV02618.1 Uncharacterised protein [Legionella waltersii]
MLSQYKLILLASLNLMLFAQTTLANDTAVGGEGSLPVPISQPNIEMVNETIRITGKDLNSPAMNGAWQYDCNFTFQNSLNKDLNVSMAFPFPINNGESEIAMPEGQKATVGKALVYDFKVTVNGFEIPSQSGKIAPNPDKSMYYEDAYYWKVNFPADSKVIIHHDYITGATYDVMGYHWVHYVLKTGSLWKHNTIGHTTLEVRPNTPTRLCDEIDSNIDVTKPTPAGMQIQGDGAHRKYIWDLKHFQPNEDMSLCLFTGLNFIRYKIVYKWLNTENAVNQLAKLSSKELRILRNSVFAQYGRSFKSPDLQSYFNQQWWYTLNPSYSDQMLTTDDKKFLNMLKQVD